jgi:putative ABC transport system substrate-binding protein
MLGACAAWPGVARAQNRRAARLGYLWHGAAGSERSTLDGLRAGLQDLGYVAGRDYVLEERYADGDAARLDGLARGLVESGADVLLAPGNAVIGAAMRATARLPILMTTNDPIGAGFVRSLARPGGNVTGIALSANMAFVGKWLELVREIAPAARSAAYVYYGEDAATTAAVDHMRAAAGTLGFDLALCPVSAVETMDATLRTLAQTPPDALVIGGQPALVANRARFIELAARLRRPAVYGQHDYVRDGGLMSYASSIFDVWRRLAYYVDRVLKGTQPADLPVEQPTSFRLVVNRRTADALGLVLPPAILARADEVIE